MGRVPMNEYMYLKGAFLTLLTFLLSACASPPQQGPIEYLPEQTAAASLKSATPIGQYFVLIKSVDGVPPKLLETHVAVAPGVHLIELEAQYSDPKPPYPTMRVRKTLEMRFAPNGNYACDTRPSTGGIFIWIANADTGEVLAGEAPGQKPATE
jgi:hypothetical protein